MLDTGLRRGEVAGLRVGDLNLGQMVAFIEATTSKSRRGRAVAYGASDGEGDHPLPPPPEGPPRPPDEPLWRAGRASR